MLFGQSSFPLVKVLFKKLASSKLKLEVLNAGQGQKDAQGNNLLS
jgi:hypothetical protein